MAATVTTDRVVRRPVVRPTPGWWLDASTAAAWTSLLIVVGPWVAGGVQRPGPGGTGVSSAGRLTDLVSADLLRPQGLLVARLPFVERAWGQDELVRRRHLVGLWSCNLMVGYVVLSTLLCRHGPHRRGRRALDPDGQLPRHAARRSGHCAAVARRGDVGAARPAPVAQQNLAPAHRFASLGVDLALPDQLWTGSDFLDRPHATAFWWTGTAGSVVCRLGLPAWPSWRRRLVVEQSGREGPVVSVRLTGRHPDRLPVRAEQFFTWRLLSGITPGLALLQEIAGPKTDAVFVHRISTEADRLFADELTELSSKRGVRVLTAVGHRSADRPCWQPAGTAHPPDHEALLRAVPDLADRDVFDFVYRPPPWTEAVLAAAPAAGVAPTQLHVEHFFCERGALMRRITLWLCTTASAVVLVFSYHTSTEGAAGTRSTGKLLTPGTTAGAPTAAAAAAPVAATVVNGSVANTRYGPVQVQITLQAGKLATVRAVAYPTEGRDGEINAQAIPVLDDEATTAKNAQIDTVSGATFTSQGYRESLQAALDAAHL